jgi:hypothetical protein
MVNRWMIVAAAVLVESIGGLGYIFSVRPPPPLPCRGGSLKAFHEVQGAWTDPN